MSEPEIPKEGDWWKVPDIDLQALAEHLDEEVQKAARKEIRFRSKRQEQPE